MRLLSYSNGGARTVTSMSIASNAQGPCMTHTNPSPSEYPLRTGSPAVRRQPWLTVGEQVSVGVVGARSELSDLRVGPLQTMRDGGRHICCGVAGSRLRISPRRCSHVVPCVG